jgi:hypothetical protein
MKQLIPVFTLCLFVSCTGRGGGAAQQATKDSATLLIDTQKLKQDIGDVMRSMDARHPPDTTALKATASDILTTDATVLSDSGIDQLGDKNDPAAQQAQKELKKMRDAMGLTPDKLDSIRKAAAALH